MTLQLTPFHHFFGAPIIVIDSYLFDDICSRYKRNKKYVIGDKKLTCIVEDFGRILGVPRTSEYMNKTIMITVTLFMTNICICIL